MIFEGLLYFIRNGREESFHIIFDSDTPENAIDDVYRWALDRKRCLPDVFNLLVCVKIAEYPIGRIDPNGALRTGMCWPFHEWKIDHPDGKQAAKKLMNQSPGGNPE